MPLKFSSDPNCSVNCSVSYLVGPFYLQGSPLFLSLPVRIECVQDQIKFVALCPHIIIVTRQRQASGFVAARLGSDMVVGTYVGKEVGV